MKRFAQVALVLSIILMCAGPIEVWGQNRRTSSSSEQKTEQKTDKKKESADKKSANIKKSEKSEMKADPSKSSYTRKKTTSTVSSDRNDYKRGKTDARNISAQDRKKHTLSIQKKSAVKDYRKESHGNRNVNNRDKYDNRFKQPNAIQYHKNPPVPRKNWERPYLKDNYRSSPSNRYGNHHFGYRSHSIPRQAKTWLHGNVKYYYYNGIYYRPYRYGGYVICRPPIGTQYLSTMLDIALTAATINYYNSLENMKHDAIQLAAYYSSNNNNYISRSAQEIASNIPNEDSQYYYEEGVFYTLKNGQYYVIEPPIGALLTQLPEDYEEIELNGNTYYQVENTLYKTTVINGALYFEVVCNL